MDLDIETAVLDSPSRFTKVLAVVVGITAIVAAVLAFTDNYTGRQEQRSLVLSARLAAAASGRLPATGSHASFGLRALQDAILQQARGTAYVLSGFELQGEDAELLTTIGEGETAAGERLAGVAQEMGAVPGADSGVDAYTIEVLTAGLEAANQLVEQQNAEVDRAELYSRRGNRAVLALSILAVAAVLFGFSGAVRDSRPGVAALSVGAVFLVAATAIGISSLFA